jgi:hypothetical protein
VPFAGVVIKGVKGFLGGAKKVINGAAEGINDLLLSTRKTKTRVKNCFVAGTEILTTDGIKLVFSRVR